MTTIHQKKQDNNKNTIGSVVTGVAEAVVIAGVAAVATMALKDNKTRKKVKKALINIKDQGVAYVETLQKESNAGEGTNKARKIAKKVSHYTGKQILTTKINTKGGE